MPEFDRLLLFRALRPDRLTAAMRKFVTAVLGGRYVASAPFDLEASFADAGPGTPILVFLSPGVDVVRGFAGGPRGGAQRRLQAVMRQHARTALLLACRVQRITG